MQQNQTITLGKLNTLKAARDSEYGYYLQSLDGQEVLLPNTYIFEDTMPLESLLEVFVYTDSEDRPVATTEKPFAMLGEYGYFEVVHYERYGAFVNWGLPKDLFVPLSQQKEYFHIGKKYLLRICLDEQTNRLYATQKIGKYFNRTIKGLQQNKVLDIIILAITPLGFKVIADNQYEGMLFSNEVFEPLEVGMRKKAYVKKVRSDGKLDMSLQVIGSKNQGNRLEESVLSALKKAGGKLPFTYKSDAELIQKEFAMSKKNFKKTLTALLEQKCIALSDEGLVLL